ncbi:hypothetical protein ES319_A04G021300v1 [Gossypium barbadense]|uniref:Uncharacterized protein n=2 Tax=Gossypium TaxID=3633 RepID=A0A5J5W2L4_GOSBA|nr:hypothetical protein ES319_A04G021300v1 [Gossypium barbadense]TYH21210.1 hypothetical protein ES288_A04G025100v1 [Gossypium darwinii]
MLKIYKDYNEENTSLVDDSAEKVIYNPKKVVPFGSVWKIWS